jgi:hypothetical protein
MPTLPGAVAPGPGGWTSTESPQAAQLEQLGQREQRSGLLSQVGSEAEAADKAQRTAAFGREYNEALRETDERESKARRDEEDRERKRLDEEHEKLGAQKLDSGRWYRNQSTADKIRLGIASFLSGLDPHGGNRVLDMIKQHVDDDMADQRAELQAKQGNLTYKENRFAQLQKRNVDDAQAARQFRLEALQDTANQVRDVAAPHGADVRAKGEQLIGQLDQLAGKELAAHQRYVAPTTGGLTQGQFDKEVSDLVKAKTFPSVEEAQEAVRRIHHLGSNGAASPSYYVAPKANGGALSPRLVKRVAELHEQEEAATRLKTALEGGRELPGEARARAQADATLLRNAGHGSVPADPLQILGMPGARAAGVDEVLKQIRAERQRIESGGAGATDEPGEAEIPGFEAVK